jgi:hypothetical protein
LSHSFVLSIDDSLFDYGSMLRRSLEQGRKKASEQGDMLHESPNDFAKPMNFQSHTLVGNRQFEIDNNRLPKPFPCMVRKTGAKN